MEYWKIKNEKLDIKEDCEESDTRIQEEDLVKIETSETINDFKEIKVWTSNSKKLNFKEDLKESDTRPTKTRELEIPPAGPSQSVQRPVIMQNFETPPKRSKLDVSLLDLNGVLESTITGRALKALYKKNEEFEPKYQSYLCDLIVQHFLNQQSVFQRLTNEDLSNIADGIIQLFPKEVKTTYYIEPLRKRFSKDNKPGFARGKLTDKYRNRLTFLRKAGMIPHVRETSSSFSETEITEIIVESSVEEEIQNDLLWLQHNSEPWDTVEKKWNSTFEYRQKLFEKTSEKTSTDVQEITKTYNILKHPLACTLLDLDFKKIYKNSHGKLFSSFDAVFDIVVQLRKQCLNKNEHLLLDIVESQSENLSSNAREYIQLSLLCSLLPPKTFKRSAKAWIPSSDESKEGVMVHVKIPEDIPLTIENKKKKFAKYGLALQQPFVIIEGPTFNSIENIFISFNDVLYKANSVLKALDSCFQIITLLNLKYPYESEHIWLFIQKVIYNIDTKYDNLPNILDIVNKVKNRLR